MSEDTIDSVDIAALFDGESSMCDAAIWAGLRRTGAILITGFPGAEDVDARARTGLSIFDLSAPEKQALAIRQFAPGNPNQWRGYWPPTTKRLLKTEQFDIGPNVPMQGPDLPGIDLLTEPNTLPERDPVPGWRQTVTQHYDHLNHVAQALIRSIGRSAGFASDEIGRRFDGAHSTLRFLNYPDGARGETAPDGLALSAGRHTDSSGLSLLWQEKPGLQAEGQDGVFRDVPAARNAISVHVGNVMTRMTAGAVPATPHRVVARAEPRMSVGFFLEPALSAPVTSAVQAGTDRVKDSYAWQLLEVLSQREMWAGIVPHPGLRRKTATSTGLPRT